MKITIETGKLTSMQLARLSGAIIEALSNEVNPYYVIHRSFHSKKIVIEAKPSGIKA